jgi:hypothetical protein
MGQRLLRFSLLIVLVLILIKPALSSEDDPPLAGKSIEPGKDSVDMLSGISCKIKDYTVYINWRITNPKTIYYFDVQRLDPQKKDYKTLKREKKLKLDDFFEKSVDGNGLNVFKYDFEDEPEHDGVYYYRIRAFNGNNELMFTSDETKIGIAGLRNFSLEQNYPNPFNPTTNITYQLFQEANVKLKVFDIVGREITTLVDRSQSAGTYTVEFDVSKFSNLTSGIYFYKLDTERYSEVKKMILTK